MSCGDFLQQRCCCDKGTYPRIGMTMRDEFAMTAITGFSKVVMDYGWDDEVLKGHAQTAYRLADAMLEARQL